MIDDTPERGHNLLPPERTNLTTFDLMDSVCGVVVDHYGESRHGIKKCANDAGCSPSTARNWFRKRTGMQLKHFVELAKRIPALKSLAVQLLELEAAVDPEFEAKLQEAMRAYARARGWAP